MINTQHHYKNHLAVEVRETCTDKDVAAKGVSSDADIIEILVLVQKYVKQD